MSDDGNNDSSCDVSVAKCIVAPVGLASHGGVISFSGVNIASSDCVCATQHERCLSPLKEWAVILVTPAWTFRTNIKKIRDPKRV